MASGAVEKQQAVGRGQRAFRRGQGAGQCRRESRRTLAGSGAPSTFDLRLFDFSKNEATDLYENKGSAPAKIGNEATVEGSGQSAGDSGQLRSGRDCRAMAPRNRHRPAPGERPAFNL